LASFLTDQNFNGDILTGLLASEPTLDIVRAQDESLSQVPDEQLLAWAAEEGRVLFTHDKHTMIGFAYDRVKASMVMPGLVHVRQNLPVAAEIEDLLILALLGTEEDFIDQVIHVPLRHMR